MRIARDFGGVSILLPEGVSDLKDAPYTWFEAVRGALFFLGFDELLDDERPPRKIWDNGEKLNAWFDEVKRKRDKKYGVDTNSTTGEEQKNDATRFLIADD